MHKFRTMTLFAISGLATSQTCAESVKMLSLDWTSQQVLTKVLGDLLERNNVSVEYVYSGSDSQWFKLASNRGDVQVEVWEGTMAYKYQRLIDKGTIIEGGTHVATTREDWWYPDYTEKVCPGLPNWEALKQCHQAFADGGEKGIYYTGPWEKPDAARIRALGLNFNVVKLKDSNEINQKIERHISEKKPLLIFNWSPNWVEVKYQGKFVEFPAYEADCESRASWGINPKYTWDCGNPKGGWLKIAISKRLMDKSKCAVDMINSFSLDNAQISMASMLVDHQKMSVRDAASEWLKENKASIDKWTSHASCEPS